MNPLVRVQIENNATTASAWASFAAHRNRVTGLLQARSAASRLCVLGAGNCNDLDIGELLASHAEIHLVDLDADALSGGIARQNVNAHRSIHTHAPFDLSGRLEAMASWRPSAPVADADVELCIRCATEVASELPGPFQLTASNCVLSQLIDAVTDAIGASHPRFADLVGAVRLGHLRLMAEPYIARRHGSLDHRRRLVRHLPRAASGYRQGSAGIARAGRGSTELLSRNKSGRSRSGSPLRCGLEIVFPSARMDSPLGLESGAALVPGSRRGAPTASGDPNFRFGSKGNQWTSDECLRRAVKSISRSQWKGGFARNLALSGATSVARYQLRLLFAAKQASRKVTNIASVRDDFSLRSIANQRNTGAGGQWALADVTDSVAHLKLKTDVGIHPKTVVTGGIVSQAYMIVRASE